MGRLAQSGHTSIAEKFNDNIKILYIVVHWITQNTTIKYHTSSSKSIRMRISSGVRESNIRFRSVYMYDSKIIVDDNSIHDIIITHIIL
jgi:hypothetical protein